MSWRLPDWLRDDTGVVRKVYLPESGGWLYQYRDPNGMFSHVFVPDVNAWASAIGFAVAHAKDPVRVMPLLDAVTHVKQAIPKGH